MWIAGRCSGGGRIFVFESFRIHFDKTTFPSGQNFSGAIADLANVIVAATVLLSFVRFDYQILVEWDRSNVFDQSIGGDGSDIFEAVYLTHCFVEDERDDAARG